MSVVLAEPHNNEPVEDWAQSFLALAQVSGEMARTAFVPTSLRVFHNNQYDHAATAAQVTAAILTGRELGLEPMAALRSIHVIQATPALSALALRAIVLAAGHRIWVEEATNTRAIVAGVRNGDTHEQRVTWTTDDAKARGLAGRPNWRTQPRNMLIARATAELARLIAADAILGVPYVIEEIEDGDTEQQELPSTDTPPPPRPLRRRRKPATPAIVNHSEPRTEPNPAAEDEPPLDDQPNEPAKPSDAQMRKLHALFRDRGLVDRDDRLDWTNEHLDRTVVSSAELTDAEASTLIDALEQEIAAFDALAPEQAPPDDTQHESPTTPAAPAGTASRGARGPAAPAQRTITRDSAEILRHMQREAGMTPTPMNELLKLTLDQARELQAQINAAMDERLADE